MTEEKTIKMTLSDLRKLVNETLEEMMSANDNSSGDGSIVYPQELDGVATKEVAGVYLVHTRDLDDLLFPEDFGPWDMEDDEKEYFYKSWAKAHGGIYYITSALLRKHLDDELVKAAMEDGVGLVVYR